MFVKRLLRGVKKIGSYLKWVYFTRTIERGPTPFTYRSHIEATCAPNMFTLCTTKQQSNKSLSMGADEVKLRLKPWRSKLDCSAPTMRQYGFLFHHLRHFCRQNSSCCSLLIFNDRTTSPKSFKRDWGNVPGHDNVSLCRSLCQHYKSSEFSICTTKKM